jgi:TetR/AcrR family transcriptional regulator, transcriptional repressor for nem operon
MAAGRPKEFVEEEALDKAIEVFCIKGYEASSTEDLLLAMKMGKGSLYHTFGSKRELFDKSLDHYIDGYLEQFDQDLEKSNKPIALIKKFIMDIAVDNLERHRKGCFLGNSVVGLSGTDPEMAKRAAGKLKAIEELFYIHIRRAQINGILKTKENARTLARHLITLWNGLNITRRMYPDPKALRELIDFQLALLT